MASDVDHAVDRALDSATTSMCEALDDILSRHGVPASTVVRSLEQRWGYDFSEIYETWVSEADQ